MSKNLTERIMVRVDEKTYNTLAVKAGREQRHISEYVRLLILEDISANGDTKDKVESVA